MFFDLKDLSKSSGITLFAITKIKYSTSKNDRKNRSFIVIRFLLQIVRLLISYSFV